MAASRPVGSHKANVAFTLAQVVLKESRHGDENDDDEGGDHRRPGTENRPSTFCGYKNQKKKKNLPKSAIKEPCTQRAWPAGKGKPAYLAADQVPQFLHRKRDRRVGRNDRGVKVAVGRVVHAEGVHHVTHGASLLPVSLPATKRKCVCVWGGVWVCVARKGHGTHKSRQQAAANSDTVSPGKPHPASRWVCWWA